MHRQSLGSPGSNHLLNSHGVIVGGRDDVSLSAAFTTEAPPPESSASNYHDDEDENRKSLKRLSKSEKYYVHLIPVLTVLCFLILYLSSHHPSQTDLAQFNGFKAFSKPIEYGDIADFNGVAEIEKGNILAIRSMRNLREIHSESSKHRFHRKIADF